MTQRKFQFQRPKDTNEHIEAIYEELCSTPLNRNREPVETLKDHVVALLAHARQIEWKRKFEQESENASIEFSLLTLAIMSVVFLWSSWGESNDWEWFNNHRLAVRLWGIVFAAMFVGISIERSSLFRKLWSFGFTKVIASVAVSSLLIFSTGKASSLINGVFGVDASVFPFTRAFITGLLAFQYFSPLLFVVAVFAVLHAFDVAGYIQSKFSSSYTYVAPPLHSIAFLVLAIVVLCISWRWVNRDFSESTYPARIYRLAHVLDFNFRHSCVNIKDGVSVVFVGADHSKVLVDMSEVQTDNIESFVDPKVSGDVKLPSKFFYLPCTPGIRSE